MIEEGGNFMGRVMRHEDMSRTGTLAVSIQEDGDVIFAVAGEDRGNGHGQPLAHVEFCNSGGKSALTREAGRLLYHAMLLDQIRSPQFGETILPPSQQSFCTPEELYRRILMQACHLTNMAGDDKLAEMLRRERHEPDAEYLEQLGFVPLRPETGSRYLILSWPAGPGKIDKSAIWCPEQKNFTYSTCVEGSIVFEARTIKVLHEHLRLFGYKHELMGNNTDVGDPLA